ncbi:primosomal protein N' [Microaerobacter geothermalis]|uniref:primosomal protein N' n=1 Tax=Microaerobacter geothermalis TaxID=674972 RepID=UPI001F2F8AF5|nr:primosomal protein N' [Microaerobacter geothermalis]MCF6094883.1 primosomal protein N' [Microaerobacter geothermalis]
MIAKVVIDLPVDSIDKPFDYAVPGSLIPLIKKGCRVMVPFGTMKRMGFVVELVDSPSIIHVKEILEVLDDHPLLTEELIVLGEWMSQYYLCPMAKVYQAMIPSMLRLKYIKYASVNDQALDQYLILTPEEEKIMSEIKRKGKIPLEVLTLTYSDHRDIIQKWMGEGTIKISNVVDDGITRKKVTYVELSKKQAEIVRYMEQLSAREEGQKKILRLLLDAPCNTHFPLSKLLEQTGVSRSAVKTLEKKKMIRVFQKEVYRDPFQGTKADIVPKPELTDAQRENLKKINQAIHQGKEEVFVLYGVTGSGKTEVYLRAIEHTLQLGKQAIVLVPEISLTPQMVERFRGRFGNRVAVLHSQLSKGERFDEWRKIIYGEVDVVIGARSAIFAPLQKIGLIVLDEEHESSYKQEDSPRYHAREIALFRGAYHGAVTILGSATPSLESIQKAGKGVYHWLSMPNRVKGQRLPTIHIVDMREELKQGNRSIFCQSLLHMMEDRLNKKEQIVLFLNRRGFSTFVMCRNCGYVEQCPHCDISLTYHHTDQTLKCHYCGYVKGNVKICPSCQSHQIRFFGTGTQRVEEEIAKQFPGARVIRMDVDTTRKKGSHEKMLNAFGKGQADILLGTQMIAKGLDFPKVTLVGVISADNMLHLPDFRASERTFQLLTQVAGRSGRHELSGDVIIQTYTPEHYAIQYVKEHKFQEFVRHEMGIRANFGYPPYSRLFLVTFSHQDLGVLMKESNAFVSHLKGKIKGNTQILGPAPSPIPRIKDRYRFQCMIKYNDEPIQRMVSEVLERLEKKIRQSQIRISIDVDPQILT